MKLIQGIKQIVTTYQLQNTNCRLYSNKVTEANAYSPRPRPNRWTIRVTDHEVYTDSYVVAVVAHVSSHHCG